MVIEQLRLILIPVIFFDAHVILASFNQDETSQLLYPLYVNYFMLDGVIGRPNNDCLEGNDIHKLSMGDRVEFALNFRYR